ncbi:hypothetical protein AB0L14_37050 [Streptomyces sp. NPDC052727]|uniref:hypothetical protein n=1 Tax=Streptomyces sp. NPDC052727 TaxID=3154854 RepID=UPI0034293799
MPPRPCGVREWLTEWTAVGAEGVVYKGLDGPYEPSVRGWRKHKARETKDAIVGAFTGSPAGPRTLLLGRYDTAGHLRAIGRSTTLPRSAGRAIAPLLTPPAASTPGRDGRSAPPGAHARPCTSPSYSPSWSWM